MNAISVSVLNTQIKSLLETTFMQVCVSGEISNLTFHSSGHIYFSIKDESSTISCVMFKGNAQYLKFRLENGQKVQIIANITVYVPRGNYQLLCTKIEPEGIGSLALAYEQLKAKLQAKGYFEQSIKKALPKYPKKIAIVTSPTGAAIEDIVKNIKYADSLNCDIIVVGRGGGSIEDLWAFNSEIVADAIFEAKTPIISSVGHETDVLISDFVADIRASTPSNAMEIALPDKNEHLLYLANFINEFENRFKTIFQQKQIELENLKKLFAQNSIEAKIFFVQSQIKLIKENFNTIFSQKLNIYQNSIDSLKQNYILNKPEKNDKIGFVQLSKNNKIISLEDLKTDDIIELQSTKIVANCKIISLKKQK